MQDSIEDNAQRPNVDPEAFVPLVGDDLGSEVGRCAALLLDQLVLIDEPGYAKIADLDFPFVVHKHVVQLDIPVKDRATVTVCKPMQNLSEYLLRFIFLKAFLCLYVLKQVASRCVLHHKQEVLAALEHFVEPDDVGMSDFPQNVNFLHNFLPGVGVLHVFFVDGLDGDVPSGQLVNCKCHFAERALANQLDKLVELERGLGHRLVLVVVVLIVRNQFFAFNHHLLVDR